MSAPFKSYICNQMSGTKTCLLLIPLKKQTGSERKFTQVWPRHRHLAQPPAIKPPLEWHPQNRDGPQNTKQQGRTLISKSRSRFGQTVPLTQLLLFSKRPRG